MEAVMRNKSFLMSQYMFTSFLVALAHMGAFTCIWTGKCLTVSWRPQKTKDVYLCSLPLKKALLNMIYHRDIVVSCVEKPF